MTEADRALAGAPETPDAFAEWVRPQLAAMSRLAARLTTVADRDDIVQEALARAWRKRAQYDSRRGTPAAWLLAITADQARQALRRRRPIQLLVDVPAAEGQRGDAADVALDVERAVSMLPPRQRLAVDCYYFAGLSIAETAAVMRCAQGTVKSTLSDARDRLRELLEVADERHR